MKRKDRDNSSVVTDSADSALISDGPPSEVTATEVKKRRTGPFAARELSMSDGCEHIFIIHTYNHIQAFCSRMRRCDRQRRSVGEFSGSSLGRGEILPAKVEQVPHSHVCGRRGQVGFSFFSEGAERSQRVDDDGITSSR